MPKMTPVRMACARQIDAIRPVMSRSTQAAPATCPSRVAVTNSDRAWEEIRPVRGSAASWAVGTITDSPRSERATSSAGKKSVIWRPTSSGA